MQRMYTIWTRHCYSAFAGTKFRNEAKRKRNRGSALVGVCTEYLRLHTAVDAYNKGFQIVVYEKAVASFNAQGHEYALGHFKSCLNAEVK